jgi:phosphoglycolate phosphatase
MAGTQLLLLNDDLAASGVDQMLDLLTPASDHHNLVLGGQAIHDAHEVIEHRPSRDGVQHLVHVGFHAGALARGEDDGGECLVSRHVFPVLSGRPVATENLPLPAHLPSGRGMNDLGFDVVAFDLDGTLADTSPDIAAALNHALRRFERPPIDVARVRELVGEGTRALLHKAFRETGGSREELVEQGLPIFIDYYAQHVCEGTRAYPGAEEALVAVARRGARLALCTNKLEGLSRALLAALGWSDRFAAIIGGDTLPVRKPDPAPLLEAIARAGGGRAIFVGDSITDANTARAAGVPFVAVSFGFRDRPVAALGAEAIVNRFDELEHILPRLA